MRTIHTDVFTYAELDDDAKAKARDWMREAMAGDNFFADYITEEFTALLAALGFNIKTRRGGAERSTLTWSGFSSQGDGAAFGGCWYASDCKPRAWLSERPKVWSDESGGHECPSNKAWHEACAPIMALAAQYPHASAFIDTGRGHFMRLDSFTDGDDSDSDDSDAAGERFIDAARDLAATFYRALETEYEYQNSDAQIAEAIEANEYEFTRDGKCA